MRVNETDAANLLSCFSASSRPYRITLTSNRLFLLLDTTTHTHGPTQESNIMHQLTCRQPLSFSPALWVAGAVCSEDREPVAIKQMHHLKPQSSFHQRGNIYERLIAL